MRTVRWRLAAVGAVIPTLALLALAVASAAAQELKGPIRIGVIYDLSGPFAAAGSVACLRGAEIAIDMINEKGGVLGKYKVEAVKADSQSKADAAINEVERLLGVEKLPIVVGVYSSAHAVPLAEIVDKQKKILWITTAIAVLKDRHLQYVFRGQALGSQFGESSVRYIAEYSQPRLHIKPSDLKVAIIYEDGPYGTGVAASNEAEAKKQGMKVVLKEGYSVSAPDLSSLVTKLRAARPDVLFHTGYNPDIALFMRQAKELGLRVKAIVGHGAGHSQLSKLKETFGEDYQYFHSVDPVAAQLLDPKKLKPGVGDLTAEMVKRAKTMPGAEALPPHVSMGFNQTWVLLTDVLPRAIQKYGGWDPEAVRKAALETDIPEGGTIQGYGVKFAPPDHPMAGQNLRSFPVVFQYVKGKVEVVYPKSIQTTEPVLPLPPESPWAAR
ncbi:MAG: ABC transporter ATP-binding protein [Candidatus Rokuibacteriota bacterium]|nr:MAG: ABC transporter ATP-binding protein [Candidatus Rokubacteria bacterium]